MTLKRSSFIYKQIAENRQTLLRRIPSNLQGAVVLALNQRYEELYESEANGEVLLEDTLKEILGSFRVSHQLLGQLRYVWMALTLAVIVEPTVKYYQPDSQIPKETINHLTDWLLKTFVEMLAPKKQLHSDIKNIDSVISADFQYLISTKKVSSFQVLSEALDVYINAIKTLEPDQSLQALLSILDDCLEGYAVFPGSYGRRELFNWWLLDVVPSCWYLLPPTSAYSLNDSTDTDKSSALSHLERISSLLWSSIFSATQNQNENSEDLLNFHDNTLPTLSDEVEIQIKYSQPLLSSNKNV